MTRALLAVLLCLCGTAAWGQNLIYPAYPQPPAPSFYAQYPPVYGGFSPYGFGGYGLAGYGVGGYGLGGFGYGGLGYGGLGYGGLGYGLGYGGFGFGARGYYPVNALGNFNWLPPNRPSPYYVTPSPGQYLDQAQRREQATYADILLEHNAQP